MNLSLVVSRQCLTGDSRTGRAFGILSFKCILQPKRKSSPTLIFCARDKKHSIKLTLRKLCEYGTVLTTGKMLPVTM